MRLSLRQEQTLEQLARRPGRTPFRYLAGGRGSTGFGQVVKTLERKGLIIVWWNETTSDRELELAAAGAEELRRRRRALTLPVFGQQLDLGDSLTTSKRGGP